MKTQAHSAPISDARPSSPFVKRIANSLSGSGRVGITRSFSGTFLSSRKMKYNDFAALQESILSDPESLKANSQVYLQRFTALADQGQIDNATDIGFIELITTEAYYDLSEVESREAFYSMLGRFTECDIFSESEACIKFQALTHFATLDPSDLEHVRPDQVADVFISFIRSGAVSLESDGLQSMLQTHSPALYEVILRKLRPEDELLVQIRLYLRELIESNDTEDAKIIAAARAYGVMAEMGLMKLDVHFDATVSAGGIVADAEVDTVDAYDAQELYIIADDHFDHANPEVVFEVCSMTLRFLNAKLLDDSHLLVLQAMIALKLSKSTDIRVVRLVAHMISCIDELDDEYMKLYFVNICDSMMRDRVFCQSVLASDDWTVLGMIYPLLALMPLSAEEGLTLIGYKALEHLLSVLESGRVQTLEDDDSAMLYDFLERMFIHRFPTNDIRDHSLKPEYIDDEDSRLWNLAIVDIQYCLDTVYTARKQEGQLSL